MAFLDFKIMQGAAWVKLFNFEGNYKVLLVAENIYDITVSMLLFLYNTNTDPIPL